MSGCTAPSTRLGNTLELTSPGTSSYGIIRSGSTPRSGTEPRTRWSGNGMISTQQREITGIPCPENCGPLSVSAVRDCWFGRRRVGGEGVVGCLQAGVGGAEVGVVGGQLIVVGSQGVVVGP